jgi:ATP-dependent helicase/nuclease subunit B
VVERNRAPFAVEALEVAPRSRLIAGIEFGTRIDRCDVLPDGGRVLIDYKTGTVAPDWRGPRPDNPQLPMYAFLRPEALVGVAYARVNAAELTFVAEIEREGVFKPGGAASQLESQPNFAALLSVWSERLQAIGAAFAAGDAAVAPTLSACKSCALAGLCRVPAALADIDADD